MHLENNISKTKTMNFNHLYVNEEYPDIIVSINNTPAENTNIFKYLVCSIRYNKPSTGDPEL